MILIIIAFIIFTFLNASLGSWLLIGFVAILEAWVFMANSSKIKVKDNGKYTQKEIEVIERYKLFFSYPMACRSLSKLFSAVQLSTYLLVPFLVYKGLYINVVIIGINYFIATQLAVILNPQFFLHDNLDNGRIKDLEQQFKYRIDMDAIDSALEKKYLK